MGLILILILAIISLMVVSMWKIYTKAGMEGWECIVPIFSTYILTKIVNKPGYWTILMLIPYVNIVFSIWVANRLSKSFGKGVGFTIGLILLPLIFYPILGLGDSEYKKLED